MGMINTGLGEVTGYYPSSEGFAGVAGSVESQRQAEQSAWFRFDDNGSGAITRDEFTSSLRDDFGYAPEESILNEAWENSDSNLDGSLDQAEFHDALESNVTVSQSDGFVT